jgi:hypothetical protein
LVAQGEVGGGGQQHLLRSQRSACASQRWQGVGGSALTGVGGNVGALMAAHWH